VRPCAPSAPECGSIRARFREPHSVWVGNVLQAARCSWFRPPWAVWSALPEEPQFNRGYAHIIPHRRAASTPTGGACAMLLAALRSAHRGGLSGSSHSQRKYLRSRFPIFPHREQV